MGLGNFLEEFFRGSKMIKVIDTFSQISDLFEEVFEVWQVLFLPQFNSFQ